MTKISTGDSAPDFTLPTGTDTPFSLSDHRGSPIVLFFYPKDDTPGCTKEAVGFTEKVSEFAAANTVVWGISKDTLTKHEKFRAKYELGIPLLSDADGDVCERYGTWVEKKMYGKTYMGIERATYLIDASGNIAEVWRKVKVPGHVDAVLEAAQNL